MNDTDFYSKRVPQTLTALEKRTQRRYSDGSGPFQIGLGRLIILTNIVGLILAAVLATNGMAIAFAIAAGIVCGFFLPGLVLLYITVYEIKKKYFGAPVIPLASELRKPKVVKSPFED